MYDTYEEFIRHLKEIQKISGTQGVLQEVYEYFYNHVQYDYDEIQVVKVRRYDENPEIEKVIQNTQKKLKSNPQNTQLIKEECIQQLDAIFRKLEPQRASICLNGEKAPHPGLTQRAIQALFSKFGTVEHIPERKSVRIQSSKSAQKDDTQNSVNQDTSTLYNPRVTPAKDIIHSIDDMAHIKPEYSDGGMLKLAVCGEYADWMNKICKELGIPSYKVIGKGTTGHSWNLIFDKKTNKWANFDMTMVRFYKDGWCIPGINPETGKKYTEEDWIMADTKHMFLMQPIRAITDLKGIDGFSKHFSPNLQISDNFFDESKTFSPNSGDINGELNRIESEFLKDIPKKLPDIVDVVHAALTKSGIVQDDVVEVKKQKNHMQNKDDIDINEGITQNKKDVEPEIF